MECQRSALQGHTAVQCTFPAGAGEEGAIADNELGLYYSALCREAEEEIVDVIDAGGLAGSASVMSFLDPL